MTLKANKDLNFLAQMFSDDIAKYHSAIWLKSDFEAPVWRCEFSTSGSFDLNFGYLISSGTLSEDVATTCKYWLIVVSSPKDSALQHALAHQYARVTLACSWIDYLILNSEHFDFGAFGFSTLTADSIQGAAHDILCKTSRAESIYRYSDRVNSMARAGIEHYPQSRVKEIIEEWPALACLPEDMSGCTPEVLLSMRAWLHDYGFLKWNSQRSFKLDSSKVSKAFFQETLRGVAAQKPFLPLFASDEYRNKSRSGNRYDAVPTSMKGQLERPSKSACVLTMRTIQCFRIMRDAELRTTWIPSYTTLDAADNTELDGPDGRFSTLPPPVAFYALRGAIEFAEEFGDVIVDSYCNILESGRNASEQPNQLSKETIHSCIAEPLRKIGITSWNDVDRKRDRFSRFADETKDFAPKSLSQHIRILYGATAIIVGTTMARRVDEMTGLDSMNAIDSSGRNLIFDNAKSTRGLGGLRAQEARPILAVAVKSIARLQRIHKALYRHGYLNAHSNLFQYPSRDDIRALCQANTWNMHRCTDAFCDFIQMPIIDGKRYYVRQHQLRRFFAMIFFWHYSFGGLDILRWFLGHKDIEMVYRYITESTPGGILRHIKAQHAAANISSHQDLGAYLQERFGINKYVFISAEKLEPYIEILLEEGSVLIEPVFFNTEQGREYKIMVKVVRNECSK
jgi:hypothetical protein